MAGTEKTPSEIPLDADPVAVQWIERCWLGLIVYVALGSFLMLTGIAGETTTHYVGLFSDAPANFVCLLVTAGAARRMPHGPLRSGWTGLTITIATYLAGTVVSASSWLHDSDPFPGTADIFFVIFYFALFLSTSFLIRAGEVRVPWLQLVLDATIFIVGFGAFFWFLAIRPIVSVNQVDFIKQALSETYIALSCVLLLTLGILQLSSSSNMPRRIPLYLLSGFSMIFVGDILWSLGKLTDRYLSGGLQDIMYLACYLPIVAAARAQMRSVRSASPPVRTAPHPLAQSLPYIAMLTAFAVLIYCARDGINGSAIVMTVIMFVLTILLMVRQSVVLRTDAQMRERQAARMVENRYASLIANAADVIMIIDTAGTVRFASPACERTLGFAPSEIVGKSLLVLWMGEDGERLKSFLAEVSASPSGTIGPIELRLDRQTSRCVLEMVGSNLTADAAVEGLALNFRDISDRKALEDQLRRLAFHDSLTLLANRTLFRDRVQHALSIAQRSEASVAVLFIDLDNFKNVNDSLGHDAGDRLLQAAAQRIVKATRASDTVARLGGDEFAVLLEGTSNIEEVEAVAQGLIDTLNHPFTLGQTKVHVAASIGVTYSSAEPNAELLLSNADIAMYHAKTAGKNRFVKFEPQMQELLQQRLQLEADINRACEHGEFFLEYQPIVDLGTRSLLGVEALIRWAHPVEGVLMPGQFIQVAEECGHIAQIGRWVLMKACQDLCDWRGAIAGGSDLRVAVNISGRHLQHGDLIHDVASALQTSGLEPANLVIELTESTMMYNTDTNLDRLRELKKLGVRLAIDDFGTGYSSLSYLHRFPIDILKIDRSFVSRLTNTDNGPGLARAVISLGETLILDTVAEGIESESQVAELLALGCVAGQGFLFAKSSSLAEISKSEFVATRNAHWNARPADEVSSATGRFAALETGRMRHLGAA